VEHYGGGREIELYLGKTKRCICGGGQNIVMNEGKQNGVLVVERRISVVVKGR